MNHATQMITCCINNYKTFQRNLWTRLYVTIKPGIIDFYLCIFVSGYTFFIWIKYTIIIDDLNIFYESASSSKDKNTLRSKFILTFVTSISTTALWPRTKKNVTWPKIPEGLIIMYGQKKHHWVSCVMSGIRSRRK